MKMMPAVRALLGQLGKTAPDGQAQQGATGQNAPAGKVPPEVQALLDQMMKGANNKDGQAADPQAAQMMAQMQALMALLSTGTPNAGQAGDPTQLLTQLQGLLGQLLKSTDGKAGADGKVDDAQAAKLMATMQALLGQMLKGSDGAPAPAPAAQTPDAQTAAAAAAAANAANSATQTAKSATPPTGLQPATGLQSSGGLTTHGLTGASLSGTPRTDADWRTLFPPKSN